MHCLTEYLDKLRRARRNVCEKKKNTHIYIKIVLLYIDVRTGCAGRLDTY